MEKLQETITQIDQIRDQILAGKLWNDGDKLSMTIVKLSALNSYLGENIADAELKTNEAETHYKYVRDKFIAETDGAVERVKAQATSAEIYRTAVYDYNRLQFAYKLLSTKRVDTSNLIDAMRSRLSFMKTEKEQSI